MRKAAVVLLAMGSFACASVGRLSELQVGASTRDVVARLGEPQANVGLMMVPGGQVNATEYRLRSETGKKAPYWLYFIDGRLALWRPAGDFKAGAQAALESQLAAAGDEPGEIRKIARGMGKPEVIAALGKPRKGISTQITPGGMTEVVEFLARDAGAEPKPVWLTFENGVLVRWEEPVQKPDEEGGADADEQRRRS